LYKNKRSTNSSQLSALAVQARTLCRLPGGLKAVGGRAGEEVELYHHRYPTNICENLEKSITSLKKKSTQEKVICE